MMYNAATVGDSLTVCDLMAKDQRLTDYYNKVMGGGKWDGSTAISLTAGFSCQTLGAERAAWEPRT